MSIELTEEQRSTFSSILDEFNNIDAPEHTEASVPNDIENIPEVLLEDESTSRFNNASWFEEIQKQVVTIAGLGGIGSWTALLIARLKVKRLRLFDDDRIDRSNLGGQLYPTVTIGNFKVEGVQCIIRDFADYYSSTGCNRKFTNNDEASSIMIGGFDNMEARKIFFDRWKDRINSGSPEEKKRCLLIDARMAAEQFQIFCLQGDDKVNIKKYEKEWLFSDTEAEETVCSYKQTSFCANLVAGYIVNLFVNFIANKVDFFMPRSVPFFTSYDCKLMRFIKES